MPNAVSGKHVRNVMWLDKCMSSLRGLNRILHSVLGCRYITSRSGGLKPSAVAGRPSVTRFTSTKRSLSRNASNAPFPCLLLLSAPGSPKQLHWSQACCCFLTCEDDVAYWHSSCFRLLGAVGSALRSSGLEGNLSPLSGLDCNPRGSYLQIGSRTGEFRITGDMAGRLLRVGEQNPPIMPRTDSMPSRIKLKKETSRT